ncbi:MAG: lysophospholipid acyltransferase family protein [Terriglobales bacterium]
MPSVKTPIEIDRAPEVPEAAGPAQPALGTVSRRYGWPSRLRSYFIFDPLIWTYTVVLGIISIPVSLFGDKGRILHGFARFWSRLIMKTISSPTRVAGMEAIDTSKPYVYAVNHASALDIPVLYVYLPFEFRIAFKKELLAYPIVGWHLKRSGQICVDQQNPARSIGSIRAALKSLKSGMPLVIFPEGGRTPDGEIKPFLPGALFLAIKAQVDIVPVALVGTFELLPMNTYHIKCRPLEMRVGQPISTSGYSVRNMDALSDRVHQAVEDLYNGAAV